MVLSSSSRAYIEQQTPCVRPWYYLEPVVLKPEHIGEPHIYIGRSQGMYSSTNTSFGMGKPVWDARASSVGQPIQVAIGPSFRGKLGQWLKFQSSDALAAMGPAGVQGPPTSEPVRTFDRDVPAEDIEIDESALRYEAYGGGPAIMEAALPAEMPASVVSADAAMEVSDTAVAPPKKKKKTFKAVPEQGP